MQLDLRIRTTCKETRPCACVVKVILFSVCGCVWLINSHDHWRCSPLFYSPHINSTIASTLLLHPPDCDNEAHAGAQARARVLKRAAGCESPGRVQLRSRRGRLQDETRYTATIHLWMTFSSQVLLLPPALHPGSKMHLLQLVGLCSFKIKK